MYMLLYIVGAAGGKRFWEVRFENHQQRARPTFTTAEERVRTQALYDLEFVYRHGQHM